ncbi:MAG: RDD family protein [Acidimicrobiia bacterium]
MVTEDDDRTHYEVLGVDRRASKEKVREAYRERLNDTQAEQINALEAKRPSDDAIASARREVARVREAWQMLSDPVQRQRYDARLGNGSSAEGDGELELADTDADDSYDEDDDEDRTPAKKAPPRGPRDRPPGMFSPEHPPTPESWPPGFTAPPPRARTIALMIDCLVLLVFFIGGQIAGVQATESISPHKSDTISRLNDQIDHLSECKDANSAAARERKSCPNANEQTDTKYDNQLDNDIGRIEKKRDDLQKDILPTQFGISSGLFLILAFLYLIPSTVRTGQTLGKRLLAIRLIQADGGRATLRVALAHYFAPLLVAVILSQILGQLAFAIVLFGVLTWSRNPNRQGLHDRLAKTVVVDG